MAVGVESGRLYQLEAEILLLVESAEEVTEEKITKPDLTQLLTQEAAEVEVEETELLLGKEAEMEALEW